MKIINVFPGVGEPMTEEMKNFMANNDNNLLFWQVEVQD